MYKENKTTEHTRNTKGNVEVPTKQKKRNPVSQFLIYGTVAMALALTVCALLLHSSMQTNAANQARIQELQQTQTPATPWATQQPTTQEFTYERPVYSAPTTNAPEELHGCDDGEC